MTWVVLGTDSTTDVVARLGYRRNRMRLLHSSLAEREGHQTKLRIGAAKRYCFAN